MCTSVHILYTYANKQTSELCILLLGNLSLLLLQQWPPLMRLPTYCAFLPSPQIQSPSPLHVMADWTSLSRCPKGTTRQHIQNRSHPLPLATWSPPALRVSVRGGSTTNHLVELEAHIVADCSFSPTLSLP